MLNTTKKFEDIYDFTQRQRSLPIPVRKMVHFLTESNITIEAEVLIKLDAQGCGERVARGGVETFGMTSACVPDINFEGLHEKTG